MLGYMKFAPVGSHEYRRSNIKGVGMDIIISVNAHNRSYVEHFYVCGWGAKDGVKDPMDEFSNSMHVKSIRLLLVLWVLWCSVMVL